MQLKQTNTLLPTLLATPGDDFRKRYIQDKQSVEDTVNDNLTLKLIEKERRTTGSSVTAKIRQIPPGGGYNTQRYDTNTGGKRYDTRQYDQINIALLSTVNLRRI